jgi:hypothetical protein
VRQPTQSFALQWFPAPASTQFVSVKHAAQRPESTRQNGATLLGLQAPPAAVQGATQAPFAKLAWLQMFPLPH